MGEADPQEEWSESNVNQGIRHNGVVVSVQQWQSHKKPVLTVQFADENRIYKVASFNSVESADWFIEVMEEFFEGLVNKCTNLH